MPKPSKFRLLQPRDAFLVGILLVVGCGSSASDPSQPPAAGGATGSAGAPSSAGGSSIPTAGANSSAGATSSAGASNAGGSAGSGGRPATGGAAGASAAGSAGLGSAGAGSATVGDVWIAPDGADTNAGTEAQPFKNLAYALTRLTTGSTVWIKPGTYKYTAALQLSKAGTEAKPFTIAAAPGARPVLDFATPTGVRGFEIAGDYWHLKGLEVENASDNCIAISGSHNTIEDVVIHNCGDTGLQITVGSAQVADATRGANNLVLNCDSYENFDAATGGENADGFAAKLRVGAGNVFRGCRAYNNADDGWDFFAADDVVVIDGCWAFLNGKGVNGSNPAGDGNGFKLGGKPTSAGEGGAVHLVKNSFSFENLTCGYTQNSNPDVPMLTGCGAKDNKTDYCQTLSKSGEVSMTMSAADAKAAKRNADGSLPPMK
ncbi:MAG: right-handed parallel beta-helix repeat-containing protein [Polyangiaceae bacterium]